MTLQETILADLKTAMLAGQADRVSVLRMLNAELKNVRISKGKDAELSDADVLQTIRKEVTKRMDTSKLYTEQHQPDRAAAEAAEADMLSAYLPAQADPEVILEFLRSKVAELNLQPVPSSKGILIREARNHFGETIDGRVASTLTDQVLNS